MLLLLLLGNVLPGDEQRRINKNEDQTGYAKPLLVVDSLAVDVASRPSAEFRCG